VVACGDGFQDYYAMGDGTFEYEQCDDGNTANGDGCSATCEGEPGFICNYPGQACKDVICGDGSQDPYYVLVEGGGGTGGTGFGGMAGSGPTEPYIGYTYEGCDDGNATSGDGCNASCEPEAGWTCDMPGQPCRQPRCGDGYIDFIPGTGSGGSSGMGSGGFGGGSFGTYEECDDANVTSGDGCTASCTLEPGYSCPYGGPCKLAVCGDGIVDYPVESCDDGNTVNGDYCTSTCHYDYGGYGGFGGTSGSGPAGGFSGEATAGTGGTAIGGSPGAGMGPQGGRMSRGG
jgi:cysteine-rich repeat protein